MSNFINHFDQGADANANTHQKVTVHILKIGVNILKSNLIRYFSRFCVVILLPVLIASMQMETVRVRELVSPGDMLTCNNKSSRARMPSTSCRVRARGSRSSLAAEATSASNLALKHKGETFFKHIYLNKRDPRVLGRSPESH